MSQNKNQSNTVTVWSDDPKDKCTNCGFILAQCQCKKTEPKLKEYKFVAVFRLETKSRGGKTVTVIDQLPKNELFLKDLTKELKSKCGVKGKALIDKIKKLNPEIIAAEAIKKESEKSDFVRAEFKRLERKISTEAISALIDSLGSDLRELSAACSQLASDVASQKVIDEDDVARYQMGRVESTGFDVADAALDGKTAIALINLRNALSTGTDPVLIVSALASSLRTLAKVSGASRSAKSFELASTLAIAPWQIDKARRQLTGWSEGGLAKAVVAIAAADADIKGAASDPIYALEQAVMTVSAAKSAR